MPGFFVRHQDIAGNEVGECAPLDLNMTFSLDPPDSFTYEIPLTNPLAKQLLTRPYRIDAKIYTASGDDVMGGFITECAIEDHSKSRTLKVAGKSWLHYLDRAIWPKDPNSNYRTTTLADPTNGTVFDYTGSVDYIAYNLIREAVNDSGIADTFTFFFTGFPASGGSAAHLRIDPGDTTSIAEHLNNLMAMGTVAATPYIQCNAGKTINIDGNVLPTFGTSTPLTFKFSCADRGGNAKLISFRHGGVRGTRNIGIAQGPSSKKWAESYSGGSLYRRWDVVEEFSAPTAFGNLSTLVSSMASDSLVPDIEVTVELTSNPEIAFPWLQDIVFPGARVGLSADLRWLDLNDTFTVTTVSVACPNDGNSVYTVTMNSPNSTT